MTLEAAKTKSVSVSKAPPTRVRLSLARALETFNALGIAFVSLSEQVDTTTPTGKMVFTVLGAAAGLERSLIAERVRAGLRNARAKGKKLGRLHLTVDATRIATLRTSGVSWPKIAAELGVSVGTVYGAAHRLSKIHPKRALQATDSKPWPLKPPAFQESLDS